MNQDLFSLDMKIQTLSTKIGELALQNMYNWTDKSTEYMTDKVILEWSRIEMEKNNGAFLTMRDQLNTYQDELHILLLKEQKCRK